MPKDNLVDSHDLILNEKSKPNMDLDLQLEKAGIIQKSVAEQLDKISSNVLKIAPHYLSNPSVHPSNLAGWLRTPNMKDTKATNYQKEKAEKKLFMILEKTNEKKSLNIPEELTPKNAEYVLKNLIIDKGKELENVKKAFAPLEEQYEKNKGGYYFLASLRAEKPEQYDLFITRIKEIKENLDGLTKIYHEVQEAKEHVIAFEELTQLYAVHPYATPLASERLTSSVKSYSELPDPAYSTGSPSEHAQVLIEMIKQQVDYS